jgi:PAS domain S-box-containing protein
MQALYAVTGTATLALDAHWMWIPLVLLAGAVLVLFGMLIRSRAETRRTSMIEAAQRQRDEQFQAFVQYMPGVVNTYDVLPDGTRKVIYMGPGMDDLIGPELAAEVKTIEQFRALIPDAQLAALSTEAERVLSEGGKADIEFTVRTGPDEFRIIRNIAAPQRMEAGIIRWHGVLMDVTERRQAEQALRESEARFRQLTEGIREVFWLTDMPSGRVLYVSPAYESIWQCSPEELYGRPQAWTEVIHPGDVERVEHAFRRGAVAGTYDEAYRIVRPDGTQRWIRDRAFPVPGEGPGTRVAGIAEDITELKEAEQAARQSMLELQAIFDAYPDLMFRVGTDGTILAVHAGEPGRFNRPPGEFLGRGMQEALPDEVGDDFERAFEAMRSGETRTAFVYELEIEGEARSFEARLAGLPDEQIAVVIRDITDFKRAEAELQMHRDRLEALVAERTEKLRASLERLRAADRLAAMGTLTAGLGHDMHNMLFPIRCRLDVISLESMSPSQRRFLDALRRTIDLLESMCDGLRQFARDPDDEDAALEIIELKAWWDDISPVLRNAIPSHVVLEHDIPAGLPRVRIAPHRLTQATLNLLKNAAEAMADGGRIRLVATSDAPDLVKLSVRDEGTGMIEEVRRRATDHFFTTKTRHFSTGVGLSVVHGAATSAGGRVEIESAPRMGTTVSMLFPAGQHDVGGAPAGPPREALVTLDDPWLAAWFADVLRQLGYHVRRSEPGVDASFDVWVVDASPRWAQQAGEWAGEARIVAIGPGGDGWDLPGVERVADRDDLTAMRGALQSVSIEDPRVVQEHLE